MSNSIEKSQIIQENRRHASDTGSCEVQVALLSDRIHHLTQHLKLHSKDFHSRRGLIGLTTQRRKLLTYLKRTDLARYNTLVQKLNLKR